MYIACLCLSIASLAVGKLCADDLDRSAVEFFESKIRPVLVRECYGCHSQEAQTKGKLRGGLLVDSRDGLRKGGDSGPAVVPGDTGQSLLLNALLHQDFEMPPKGKLPADTIEDFRKWIASGAVDPRQTVPAAQQRTIDWQQAAAHWAFQPLRLNVEPPQFDLQSKIHPIDGFIRREAERKGLKINRSADAYTLIRRAWFDLLGNPPKPEEMAAWLAKLQSPADPQSTSIDLDVWKQLIDHLLASPHYGERWARHWMDVARFAESHGYEQDYDRPHAYHYRDFLIRAFNADMPYDQFVRWQLAGDELSPEDPLAWMATGFLGAGAFPTQLTEAEFESARYDELDDMVATTGVAFLGLSVGCARCHDHKFDPITSLEYYRLASTFSTVIRCEKEFDLDPAGNQAIREKHVQTLADLKQRCSAIEQVMPNRLVKWVQSARDDLELENRWTTLTGQLQSSGKTKYVQQADDSFLATGKAPDKEVVTFSVKTTLPLELAGFRIEALADDSLPRGGPGRADNGNFALGQIQLTVQPPNKPAQPLALVRALATHQQNESSLSVAASIDNDPTSGWAVDGQIGRDQAAVFFTQEPSSIEPGSTLRCTLTFQHPNGKHAMGRMRFSLTDKPDATAVVGSNGPPPSIAAQLRKLRERVHKINEQDAEPAASLSQEIRDGMEQWQETLNWFRNTQADWRELQQEVTKLEKAGAPVKLTTIQVASEGLPPMKHHADGRGYPHFYPEVHMLRRGDVHQKGDVVSPAPLGILVAHNRPIDWSQPTTVTSPKSTSSSPAPSYRRSRLAEWLTDANHGSGALLARVMVNRLWQYHFGRGLVSTPNDFGFSGEPPTHPDLLEWLASQLVRGQWKLKSIHRLIMTSQTYMLSSEAEPRMPELTQPSASMIDPENRLYWRSMPRRLEAEAVRDSVLAVSGLLDPTMYGPGTLNEAMRRRSVYFFIKRSQLIPSMMLFDWPEHLVSIGKRSSTTIAPQALLLMNGPLGRAAAEAMAERIQHPTKPADRSVAAALEQAYQLVYQRSPSPHEIEIGVLYLSKLAAARQAPTTAQSPLTGSTPAVDIPKACWSDYCQALLSANEFIFVD